MTLHDNSDADACYDFIIMSPDPIPILLLTLFLFLHMQTNQSTYLAPSLATYIIYQPVVCNPYTAELPSSVTSAHHEIETITRENLYIISISYTCLIRFQFLLFCAYLANSMPTRHSRSVISQNPNRLCILHHPAIRIQPAMSQSLMKNQILILH